MDVDKESEVRDLRARLEALEGAEPKGAAQRSGNKGCGIVGIVGALLLVGYCTARGGSDPDTASPTVEAAAPVWTPPEGYERTYTRRGAGVAVQWETPTRAECRGYNATCFALNVITERGCPRNLYVSITLFNAAGDNIGWTNDTAQGVMAGEKARLVFRTYERGAEAARIAEIGCY